VGRKGEGGEGGGGGGGEVARGLGRERNPRNNSRVMTASSSRTVKALNNSSASTTSWVGRIGVRLARTRNVATADRSARPTAIRPTTRASQDAGAAADAISAGAGCSTPLLVLNPLGVFIQEGRP